MQYIHLTMKGTKVTDQEFLQASFIAELSTEKWEEAEFLNHTVYISTTNDCRFSKVGQDPIPWIIGESFPFVSDQPVDFLQ